MVGCAAFGCTNRSEKGHRMYGFPKDTDRREKWLAMVCRKNFEVRGNHNNRKICQAHFEDNQFLATKKGHFRLRPDAVPMIFLHRSTPKRRKVPSRCMSSGVVIERSNDDQTDGRTSDLVEGDMAEEMPAGVKVNRTLLAVIGAEQHKLPVLKKVIPTPVKVVPIPAVVKITAPLPPVFKRPLQVLQPPTMGPPGGSYRCDECQQHFFSFPQYVRHKQFHDEERPFPCGVCGKRFLSRSHYKEHQRVHTGERPFPCDQCERSFTTHHNLKRHQTIHSKEEIFRCKRCGVLFCQKHLLPMGEGPVLPPPDMEQDSETDCDPEPDPSQDSAPQTLVLASNTPPALPDNAAPKSDVLRQYRLPEKLQQQIEQKLSQVPRWTNQSSFNSNLFLPANLNVSKKKTDKKRHSSHSVPMTTALGQEEELWSVHKKQPKVHRIAYDIEVVL